MENTENKKRILNKTYSIQFRFLATVVFAMLAVTIFIGGLSIYEVDKYVNTQTKNFVDVTCSNEVTQFNDNFGDMEKSVKIMESYVLEFFENVTNVADPDLQERTINSVDKMFADVTKHTGGVVAYYLRFDPSISNSKAGLFYSKLDGSDEYVALEPTDISIYDKNDVEHVGWFWQAYEAGEPIWMNPYYNQNNNILMISYVVPIYSNDKFIGVVGMDFDYNVLANNVHKIEIYDNGFAFLEIDGTAIDDYDKELKAKVDSNSQNYFTVSKKLVNGMNLVVCADYDDIRQIRYEIAFKILFVAIVLSVFFTIIVIFVVKKIVNPLKKLIDISVKLAKGDYDVEIAQSNTYEIKLLGAAFENMATRLSERERNLHISANRDSLTGLRNTTSYKAWVTRFENSIKNKDVDFGIAVLDINDLKETNDKYGHNIGDELIKTSAQIISEVFKRSPVFRIGGDEFLVVLQNRDLRDREELFALLDLNCSKKFIDENAKHSLSIASGFAMYDAEIDSEFLDVFKRADDAMYENKRKSKTVTM